MAPSAAQLLAMRTVVTRPVHERDTHDRVPAPRARLAGASVGIERVREVARLTVHVDVLRIETRPALGQRLLEDGAHVREQPIDRSRGEGAGGCLGMDAGEPESLVGVDVADAAD